MDYDTIKREGLAALGDGWHAWSEVPVEPKAARQGIVAQCRFYRLDLEGVVNVNAHRRGTYGNSVGIAGPRQASDEPRYVARWRLGKRKTGVPTVAEAAIKALRDARGDPEYAPHFPSETLFD